MMTHDMVEVSEQSIAFRNRTLAENSKATYSDTVRQYHAYLRETGLGDSPESVTGFLEDIRKTKSPATYNLRLQALKEYLCKKYERDHVQLFGILETFKGIRRLKVEKSVIREEYLTYEQVMELAEKFTERMSLLFQALFWSGCRISELIAIKVEDVKVNDKVVIKVRSGKGHKERTVYLPMRLYEKVREVFNGTEYLFETQGGKPYHRGNVWKELKRQAKKHGYDTHPHTLRHSKAMYLKDERKLTPDQIAKALGHSSVVTTLESYFHGTPSAEEQGIEG